MTIMQVGIVACLGMKNAPGRCAERSWNKSPENVLSRKGLNKGNGKMVIFTLRRLVNMLPKDTARRDEEVSAGFTSIGVTVAEL